MSTVQNKRSQRRSRPRKVLPPGLKYISLPPILFKNPNQLVSFNIPAVPNLPEGYIPRFVQISLDVAEQGPVIISGDIRTPRFRTKIMPFPETLSYPMVVSKTQASLIGQAHFWCSVTTTVVHTSNVSSGSVNLG